MSKLKMHKEQYPGIAEVIRNNSSSTIDELIKLIQLNSNAKEEMTNELISLKDCLITDVIIENRIYALFNIILWEIMNEDDPPEFVRVRNRIYQRL